jgi:hypothetical protein
MIKAEQTTPAKEGKGETKKGRAEDGFDDWPAKRDEAERRSLFVSTAS